MTAPGLSLYRGATTLLKPLAGLVLNQRARRGKEDPARLGERRGEAGLPRPDGRLAWLHAASVGESLVALTLAERLLSQTPDLHVLITSGTRTSASLIARRAPDRVIHQFPPVDSLAWVRRFLGHWRPDLAVFIESELWPNLIGETAARHIPLALVNARMNAASLRRWERWPASARTLLAAFDWIGAADQRTSEGLTLLSGRPAPLVGNLKLEAGLPDPDPDALARARAAVGDRKVFVAASTHDGEEELLAATHAKLLSRRPDALMILAPRHPERAIAAGDALDVEGLTFATRSAGETPEGKPVWLADTLGEMGLWYSLAPAAVICGSFRPGIGGHNPVEATRAGAAVITGPYTDSFGDVFAAYDARQARIVAATPTEIADAIEAVWTGQGPRPADAEAALQSLSGGAMRQTVDRLGALLDGERTS